MMLPMSAGHTVKRSAAKRRNIITMMVSFGRELTLVQRIAYSLFGLFMFSLGVLFLGVVAWGEFRAGNLFGAAAWTMPGAVLTWVGAATLINVLRFPHTRPADRQ